jgi:hypothetical protein
MEPGLHGMGSRTIFFVVSGMVEWGEISEDSLALTADLTSICLQSNRVSLGPATRETPSPLFHAKLYLAAGDMAVGSQHLPLNCVLTWE